MRSRVRWIGAGVAVVVLGGGGTAYGLTRDSGHDYRTAVAANGSVTQTIAATGTVSPVRSADASFQVAGTVAKVLVKTGRHVHAGEVLARLDRSALRDQVKSARSALHAARSRLSADESGQGGGGGGEQATLLSSHPVVAPTSTPVSTKGGSLAAEQAAVRAAQQETDADLAAAHQALAVARTACATSSDSSQDTSATVTPTQSETPSPTPTDTSGTTSCTTASADLLTAQQLVDRDESRLAAAEQALSQALASMAGAGPSGTGTSSTTNPHSSSGRGSAGGASGSASSGAVSAAQIALDQASIDQAVAQVAAAKSDLAQAALRSTIAGRVAAVTLAHGDRVSAGSSDDVVKVVGSRQEQATISVSATQVRRIKIGMSAQVVADGSSRVMTGRVVAINAAGTTSQSGTTSYPVTVTLPRGSRVVAGAAASVTLVVSSVDDVLTVPTSAVRHSGSRTYVEVIQQGKPVNRTVTTGAVGAARTQVASGLVAGQEVVLADLDRAVPSSSSNQSGGGGFFNRSGGPRITRQIGSGGPSLTIVGPPG